MEISQPFFPSGDPNFVYVYLKLPVGTDVKHTDSITHVLEGRVQKVLEKEKPGVPGSIVESIITNVAVSANNPRDNNRSVQSHLGRIQVSFVEYEKRHGKSTAIYKEQIREAVQGIPGASVEVAQEDGGPPTDPPVNIEVAGDNFESIASVATQLYNFLDTNRIKGIENLQPDVDLNNPEISINVDRERAMLEGISTGQIGMDIRTAVFGREVSKIKVGEDEYKIQLRYTDLLRNNITDIMNMGLTFMDMNTMQVKSIPVSAVAKVDYTNTTGDVKRKNVKRTIQLQSNVLDPTASGKRPSIVATAVNNTGMIRILPACIAASLVRKPLPRNSSVNSINKIPFLTTIPAKPTTPTPSMMVAIVMPVTA